MKTVLTVLAAVCGALLACSPVVATYVPETPMASGGCGHDEADLTVMTYNAGIAPGIVRHSTPRLPHAAEAIASVDADVMCIQEAWTDESVEAIRVGLGASPEGFYHADTKGEGEDPADRCDVGDLDGILECAKEHCSDSPAEELTRCAVSHCKMNGVWLYLFNRRCLNCAVSQAGKTAEEIKRACETGSGSRVYGGANGVVLASKYPLTDREFLMLPSSGANRVALFARVEVPGKGSVQVGCSHLSSAAPTSPTHPDFSDWDDEKRAQLDLVIKTMDRRAKGGPRILMMDANFGPRIGDEVREQSPALWRKAVDAGYSSPMADLVPPVCTVCGDNLTRGGGADHLIDHVFVHQGEGAARLLPTCASRELANAVEVDVYGEKKELHPSDHYASVVSFRFAEAAE